MDQTVKPKDMGTTGLIQWVTSHVLDGRRGNVIGLAHATARKIVRRRYGSPVVLERFERALQVGVNAAWAKWRAARATA